MFLIPLWALSTQIISVLALLSISQFLFLKAFIAFIQVNPIHRFPFQEHRRAIYPLNFVLKLVVALEGVAVLLLSCQHL